MTYKKPANITYVGMCKYFDDNIYKSDRDDTLLFQYLYHICYMLACKTIRFQTFEYYDDFALYASTRLYLKYPMVTNGEIVVDEDKKIKSILNYTRATLYPLKVDYQRETFAQVYSYDNEIDSTSLTDSIKNSIQKEYSDELQEYVTDALKALPKIIKRKINETLYKNDVLISKRLYISCVLSLINGMTLSNSKKQKILKKSDINERESLIIKSLQRERINSIILWHLDETMRDYVQILVNKIRKELEKDITQTRNQLNLSDVELESIMMSAFDFANNYDDDY